MTYAAEEISIQSGAPVELYTFSHGVSVWRYTSSEASFTDVSTSPNRTFTSASIQRGKIEGSTEDARNSLQLTTARSFAVAELFRVAPPTETIALTVRRVHRGDTASGSVIWVGRVLNCTFEGASASLLCEPITVSMKRTGLRRIYGLTCPHVLYATGCNLVKTDWDTSKTVTAISGSTITVGTLPAYNFAGGFVEWTNDDGNIERRFIKSYVTTATSPITNILTLLQPFVGLAVTDTVVVYPGCDHTLTTCNTTYSNAKNYGGFPFIPTKNPFIGDPIA